MTVSQLYEEAKSLPLADQVALAAKIMHSIPLQDIHGFSDEWNDEDKQDLTARSLTYAQKTYPEDEELV